MSDRIYTEVEMKEGNFHCILTTEVIYGFSGPLQFGVLPGIHKKARLSEN